MISNGHTAVPQRQTGQTYTLSGGQTRIGKYGTPSNGQWPHLTREKKLLGPPVPTMIANEEDQARARALLYEILDQEIDKRIEKMLRQKGG